MLRRIIKPDGAATFESKEHRFIVFVEFDRGHVSLPQMAGVFDRYAAYWREGSFCSVYGTDCVFTVAVITTAGQRRIDHLLKLAARSPVPVKIAKFSDLRMYGFGSAIWHDSTTCELSLLWAPAKTEVTQ